MLQRMIGAAFFNARTYEEIEADSSALGPAIGVVALVTVCGIIGGIIDGMLSGEPTPGIIAGVIGGLLFGIVRWALWTTLLYLIGGKLLRTGNTQTSWGEVGRVLGFAYTPGVLSLFTFVPFIGGLFSIVAFFWSLAAAVVAVRQAMDFESTGRAIVVALLSGIIGIVPVIILTIIQVIVFGSV